MSSGLNLLLSAHKRIPVVHTFNIRTDIVVIFCVNVGLAKNHFSKVNSVILGETFNRELLSSGRIRSNSIESLQIPCNQLLEGPQRNFLHITAFLWSEIF